jgi:hypothetical protein
MISSVRNFVIRILDADRFTIVLFQILDIKSNYLPGIVQDLRVIVHPGAKHNHRQYGCGKTKGKCTLKGHQARQKIAKGVGKSVYYQPATYRTDTFLGGYMDSVMSITLARKLEVSS